MNGFKYTLPDEFIRTLDRRGYKRVMRYLRICRRRVMAVSEEGLRIVQYRRIDTWLTAAPSGLV